MINEKNNFLTVSWLSGLLSAEIFISTGEWGVQMPPLTSENSYFLRSGPQGATLVMGGTPYVMGDTYVPRFWPPFFNLAGSSTIFLGYFSHPPTAKLSFGVQKLPIFTKIDLFGPKFNFFLDLFGSNFQRPAAHPHQFSGRVPPRVT